MFRMKVRAHVLVSGMVQGVFFRSETRRMARQCSVTGWVRNLPDGRVEAVFEGEKKNVEKMVEFCKKGPSSARIASTEISLENCTDEFNDFLIVW
jgi:acylphosphatase